MTVMLIAFIVNCMRKIMRDHKIIRVSNLHYYVSIEAEEKENFFAKFISRARKQSL